MRNMFLLQYSEIVLLCCLYLYGPEMFACAVVNRYRDVSKTQNSASHLTNAGQISNLPLSDFDNELLALF
jgi:beta-lactamase regulating signal transducer with metallopeptidase domain